MSAAMLTADWFLLGRNLYFRKFEVYSMAWHQDIHLENFLVSSAPYGGPIAIRRDDRKIVKVQGTGQPNILIFSGPGKLISTFKWTRRPIVCMGWTNDEKLLCVQEDGMVVIHDMFGKYLHTFNIIQKMQDARLVEAKIFTGVQNCTGVAVVTSNYKVFLVNNVMEPKTRPLSELPRSGVAPTCWAVVAEDSYTEILIARNMELYRLKQDEHHTSSILQADFTSNYSAIIDMAVSFNGRHVAFFTDSGILWLGSSDLRSKYAEVDTNIIYRPKQLVWCGNEAVVLYWERNNNMLIVGKHGEKMSYSYDGSVYLSPEIDCVRILSNFQHEILQKIPDVVQKIFRINSTEPGSFLLEASKQYQKNSHKANEYICLVKNDLQKAVEQCIDAVGYEFDTEVQKMLIRAAQFGKCFVPNFNSNSYVEKCRLLRVLNAVRDVKIGIPLTITQLNYLSFLVFLNRLITRNNYYLALQIAKYLKLPVEDGTNHILVHWAKYKVSQNQLEEEIVAQEIANKLKNNSGISFSEIAKTASDCGRKKLAIKLLDFESKASEQVKLLLELGESTPALLKAIESGDTDLVYMVILKLCKEMPLRDFKMTIRNYAIAQSLYIKYCKEHNTQALNEIYIQEDDFAAQAQTFILESFEDKKSHMKDSLLSSAIDAYKKGRKDLHANLCEDALKLLRFQRDLEEKLQKKDFFYGKPLHETCKILLDLNELKLVDKLKNDFKIPEKRFYWLKIKSLAQKDNWIELEKFSKVKKSPIGYAAFVDVSLGRKNETLKYLPRVAEDLKVKYYIKAGFLEEASEIAFQQKDLQGLLYVQSKANSDQKLLQKINLMIAQLDGRK